MTGVVDALGSGVSGLAVGQKVLVSSRELPNRGGCYAQAICVPADALFVLPDAIAPRVIHRGSQNVQDEVMAITAGRGVDVVFDRSGPGFTKNLDLLAPLGTLVSINPLGRNIDTDVASELRRLLGRSLGFRCYSIHTLDREPATRHALMQRAIDLMAAGHLRPPKATLIPLAEAGRAHGLLEAGASLGKIVLLPD